VKRLVFGTWQQLNKAKETWRLERLMDIWTPHFPALSEEERWCNNTENIALKAGYVINPHAYVSGRHAPQLACGSSQELDPQERKSIQMNLLPLPPKCSQYYSM
jgi:hypothetical protein